MFPWKTVGMPVSSFSSLAFCVRRMAGCLKTKHTKLALMTVYTTWFSSVPLKSSNCLSRGLWRTLEWSSCMNRPLHPSSTWLMLGRVPLIPLFLAGNSTQTIPHMFSKRKDSGFQYGCADAAATAWRRGSSVYEVNPWLWQFGRCKPSLGGLTITQTAKRKDAVSDALACCPDQTAYQGGSSLIRNTGWYMTLLAAQG